MDFIRKEPEANLIFRVVRLHAKGEKISRILSGLSQLDKEVIRREFNIDEEKNTIQRKNKKG